MPTVTTDHRIRLASVVIGPKERRLVGDVLDSGMLAQGPMVARLEAHLAEACGTTHAVAVSNGTTALQAALAVSDVGPGDEVVVPALTFGATLNAVIAAGATARIADVTTDYTVDPASVESLLTDRTRAIVPVHLYGLPADMPAISSITRRHGSVIIEDNAQAIGARVAGRATGSWGLGCLSLYATKNVAAGEGGAVTTSDPATADRLRVLRNQGMATRYEYVSPGLNWRMTDLHAAVGIGQIERLAAVTEARRANAAFLDDVVSGLDWLRRPPSPADRSHVHHQYVVAVRAGVDRSRLIAHLDASGIDAAPVYPRAVHDYPCFRDHPLVADDRTPLADRLAAAVVSLPVHQGLTAEDLDRMGCALAGFRP